MRQTPSSAGEISLCLHLLGVFRIERDTCPIALPTRKVESLLAYVALFPQEHAREKLAALFWGDSTDEQARHSLRTALATLRNKLGEDLLLADRETVRLNPEQPVWVDALEFQRMVDLRLLITDSEASTTLPPSAINTLQSAIDLYQGDLLPGFYDDWVLVERERLCQLYLDTLLRLAQEMRSQSQYARAVEFARKVLATEPTNEAAYQHLMFCYAATGDRIGALKQYDECEKKLRDELGVEPSSETVALREQIECELTGAPSREAMLTNLPTPLTSFVGRQREMAEIKRLLDPSGLGDPKGLGTRLLTLTGAGGCGKTRLAIQVATDLAHANHYKHGVWWVELAALSDPALVPKQVAHVFELPESPDVPITTTLTHYLRAKELLLVLDNCEHLIEACAPLAETLLSACPDLHLLATSREALGLTGEVIWRVPSLDSPDPQHLPPLESLAQYDAIRLLTERAQAVLPRWQLADHAEAAAHICCRLDGIPLAIELAAARLKVLSAEQVAERLDDRFQLLTGGSRTALPRHRTLRATIDWSYDLLSDEERVLFRRLAVFAGGWTLEAADAVCGGTNSSVLDPLTALVDKSLVVVEQKDDALRYRMLETVRQYAREKLLEANESELCSRRHLNWFIQLAEEAEPKLRSGEQMEWCQRLEQDIENLRAALKWSLAQIAERAEPAQRLAGALTWFWFVRGYWDEGWTWLERVLENRAITPARAKALVGLGHLEDCAGTLTRSQALYEEGLALYRQQGDKWGIAWAAGYCGRGERSDPSRARALFEEARSIAQELKDEWLATKTDNLQGNYTCDRREVSFLDTDALGSGRRKGNYACNREQLALARSLYESALEHARRCGDRVLIGIVSSNLGCVAFNQGEDDLASALFTESLKVHRELGNKNTIAGALCLLGSVARRRHDDQQAIAHFKQALVLRHEIGNTLGILECLWAFGQVAATEQRYKRAAQLLGAAESLCKMLRPKERGEYEDDVRVVRAQLDEATFDAAWAEGRAMTMEQAIEYALKT
jgi:predicted ATPase/DNA-binding SARP family transcriptional activator